MLLGHYLFSKAECVSGQIHDLVIGTENLISGKNQVISTVVYFLTQQIDIHYSVK